MVFSATTDKDNNVAGSSSSPAIAVSHARSTYTKLQACSTIKLSPVVGMGGSYDDIHEFCDDDVRDTGSARSNASGGSGGGGGDSGGGASGGLLVASVSECDGSTFGSDDYSQPEGRYTEGDIHDDGDDDDDDDDNGDGDNSSVSVANRLQRLGATYDERLKRNRSTASKQIMEVADMVASDVAIGGSPAHSNLIKRMTVVSNVFPSCITGHASWCHKTVSCQRIATFPTQKSEYSQGKNDVGRWPADGWV